MITLHLLQYLQENGFGTVGTNLFFEEIPLDKTGIGIISRGGEMSDGRISFTKRFDLYSRGVDNLSGMNDLETIREFFAEGWDSLCSLPTVPGISDRLYQKCRITRIEDVDNLGKTEGDRIMYRFGADIIYQK